MCTWCNSKQCTKYVVHAIKTHQSFLVLAFLCSFLFIAFLSSFGSSLI